MQKNYWGRTLVTHQTGPEGKEIKRLYIEEGCAIQKEYYVGFVIDRATDQVTLMASEEGALRLKKVAAKLLKKIFKETIDPVIGLHHSKQDELRLILIFLKNLLTKLLNSY